MLNAYIFFFRNSDPVGNGIDSTKWNLKIQSKYQFGRFRVSICWVSSCIPLFHRMRDAPDWIQKYHSCFTSRYIHLCLPVCYTVLSCGMQFFFYLVLPILPKWYDKWLLVLITFLDSFMLLLIPHFVCICLCISFSITNLYLCGWWQREIV